MIVGAFLRACRFSPVAEGLASLSVVTEKSCPLLQADSEVRQRRGRLFFLFVFS